MCQSDSIFVRQADVHDERNGIHFLESPEELGGGRRGRDLEALLAQAPRHERSQLGVVLEQDHVRIEHCVRSIPPGRLFRREPGHFRSRRRRHVLSVLRSR